MGDIHEVAEKARWRLASPEMTQWVKIIKKKIAALPSLRDFHQKGGFPRGNVFYLPLLPHEREILEFAACDDFGRHPRRPAAGSPALKLVEEVAGALFLRWYVALSKLFRQFHLFVLSHCCHTSCLLDPPLLLPSMALISSGAILCFQPTTSVQEEVH
jgi:hypothetical protein